MLPSPADRSHDQPHPPPRTRSNSPLETTKIPTDHEDQRDLVSRFQVDSRTAPAAGGVGAAVAAYHARSAGGSTGAWLRAAPRSCSPRSSRSGALAWPCWGRETWTGAGPRTSAAPSMSPYRYCRRPSLTPLPAGSGTVKAEAAAYRALAMELLVLDERLRPARVPHSP